MIGDDGFVAEGESVTSNACLASALSLLGFPILSDLPDTGILAGDDGFAADGESVISDACLVSALSFLGSLLLSDLPDTGNLTVDDGLVLGNQMGVV